MRRLLSIEWNKLYYYKAARIFIIIYFVLLALMGYFVSQVSFDINGVDINLVSLGSFQFPYVWQNISYFAAIGKLFLAVIVITNIANEYSNGTLKQNLIDGLSKKEFLESKMLTNIVLALLSTLFVFVISLVLGVYYTEEIQRVYKGMEFMAAYLLKMIFFFTFCMFLTFLLRKTAFSLMLLFVWWVIEKILIGMEALIRYNVLGQNPLENNTTILTNYLPLESSSNLITFPKINIESYVRGGNPFMEGSIDYTYFLSTTLYMVLFVYLSYMLLKKRDL